MITTIADSVLHAIGRTPLVRLRRLVEPGSADVLVKLEYYNPTGSGICFPRKAGLGYAVASAGTFRANWL